MTKKNKQKTIEQRNTKCLNNKIANVEIDKKTNKKQRKNKNTQVDWLLKKGIFQPMK